MLQVFPRNLLCPYQLWIDKCSLPLLGRTLLGSLGVFASETAGKTFTVNHLFHDPNDITHGLQPCKSENGSTLHVTTRFSSMRLHRNIVKYGATIWPSVPMKVYAKCHTDVKADWMYEDCEYIICVYIYIIIYMWHTSKIYSPNSEFPDFAEIFRHQLSLPHGKQGGTSPSNVGIAIINNPFLMVYTTHKDSE